MAKFEWYGDEAMAFVRAEAGKRVDLAARDLRDFAREQLSVPFPPSGEDGGWPHKRIGHLRRNVQAETDRKAAYARVGTNVLYGRYLELGTRRMARRPWLSLAISQRMATTRRILGGLV